MAFADASKTVGLLAAPQPWSVAPELFHGEKAIPGPGPKAISRGTDAVVDTSRRSKNTICRGRNRQDIFVDSGRQKAYHEKKRQATQDEPTRKHNFPRVKNREEVVVYPLGRQNFPHGKTDKRSWLIH